jgi:ferritin-like metal-binding protein YciE
MTHFLTNCEMRMMRRSSSRRRCLRWRKRQVRRICALAFESHLEETRGHVDRLEQVFANLGEKVVGKHCDGIAGIIEEGKAVMEENFDEVTLDACLIAGAQRAEHYEIAAYGTLIAWAQAMGHMDAADLLQQTLDEEKAADQKLSALAEGGHQSGSRRRGSLRNGSERG